MYTYPNETFGGSQQSGYFTRDVASMMGRLPQPEFIKMNEFPNIKGINLVAEIDPDYFTPGSFVRITTHHGIVKKYGYSNMRPFDAWQHPDVMNGMITQTGQWWIAVQAYIGRAPVIIVITIHDILNGVVVIENIDEKLFSNDAYNNNNSQPIDPNAMVFNGI